MEQRTKDDIRCEMRDRRREVSEERRRYTARKIAVELVRGRIRLAERALRVGIYLSTKHELPTHHIARALWEAGRGVCVPAWDSMLVRYQLCELLPAMPLVPGMYGIREPVEQLPVAAWDVDAFVLPGLAFDMRGGRLGYGKGIYDGVLAEANPSATKIGICYDWQILDEPLPLEPHDRRVDWVVSDKRVIHCKGATA